MIGLIVQGAGRSDRRESISRSSVPIGEFEQRVRTTGRRARSPKHATALAPGRTLDRRTARVVEIALDAQSEINHGFFIVSRRKRAILRVTPPQRALVVSSGKNSARVSVDGESGVRTAQLRRRMTGERFMPVPGDVADRPPSGRRIKPSSTASRIAHVLASEPPEVRADEPEDDGR